jgi:hypothetical protein
MDQRFAPPKQDCARRWILRQGRQSSRVRPDFSCPIQRGSAKRHLFCMLHLMLSSPFGVGFTSRFGLVHAPIAGVAGIPLASHRLICCNKHNQRLIISHLMQKSGILM